MKERTEKNFCFIHDRPKIPTRLICPQCLGSGTSPARRKAALTASKAAAEARKKRKRLAAKPEPKRGRVKSAIFDEVFS